MKNKMNKHKWMGILLTVLVLSTVLFAVTVPAHAGFGDFNDYDSGGFDFDWGSDSSDSVDCFDIFSFIVFAFEHPFIALIVVIIIVVGILVMKAKKALTPERPQAPVHVAPPNYNAVHQTIPNRTDEISNLIRQNDPAFTAPDFISYVKQVYMDIQAAWEARDLSSVRAVLHKNLYQQTEQQLEKKRQQGIINHLERISVSEAYLTSYRRDSEYEYATVYLAASMIDYQVEEATGKILYGDRTTRWNMFYKMRFMRTLGSVSRSAEERNKGFNCPNCNAPIEGTSFGVCEYCGSFVTSGDYDWVLSEFTAVKNNNTTDEGIQI